MANFSDDKIKAAWEKAQTVKEVDSNVWRKDPCDAWINRDQYGQEKDYGWEVDHIIPVSKNGTDHTENLRAMHWKNNRNKGDDFPDYNAIITSDGNKNIEKKEGKVVHKDTITRLKSIYPNNSSLQNIKSE